MEEKNKIDKNNNLENVNEDNDYMSYGMSFGLFLGIIFGAIFNNIAIGVAIGLSMGVGIGALINYNVKDKKTK